MPYYVVGYWPNGSKRYAPKEDRGPWLTEPTEAREFSTYDSADLFRVTEQAIHFLHRTVALSVVRIPAPPS